MTEEQEPDMFDDVINDLNKHRDEHYRQKQDKSAVIGILVALVIILAVA